MASKYGGASNSDYTGCTTRVALTVAIAGMTAQHHQFRQGCRAQLHRATALSVLTPLSWGSLHHLYMTGALYVMYTSLCHVSVWCLYLCRYVITTPAARNGTDCPAMQGDTRIGTCINGKPCRPVACNATWLASGPCNGSCNNGTGKLPETYFIRALPVDGGTSCTNANGTRRCVC
jgi:hypothetical protein